MDATAAAAAAAEAAASTVAPEFDTVFTMISRKASAESAAPAEFPVVPQGMAFAALQTAIAMLHVESHDLSSQEPPMEGPELLEELGTPRCSAWLATTNTSFQDTTQ